MTEGSCTYTSTLTLTLTLTHTLSHALAHTCKCCYIASSITLFHMYIYIYTYKYIQILLSSSCYIASSIALFHTGARTRTYIQILLHCKLFLSGARAQDATRRVRAWMKQMSATWTGM